MPLDFGATDYRQAMHQWFQNIMQPGPKGAAYEGQMPTGIECGQSPRLSTKRTRASAWLSEV